MGHFIMADVLGMKNDSQTVISSIILIVSNSTVTPSEVFALLGMRTYNYTITVPLVKE